MIKIAVPMAVKILSEAGYKSRGMTKALNIVDEANGVEFFFLRPKDIAIYVAKGLLDLGITGRDLAADSRVKVQELLPLGFGSSTFRYAAPQGQNWKVEDLDGKRIATSYPNVVRDYLTEHGMKAEVIRLDGAVEISIKLGVADVIADVVSTGNTLRQHGLEPFGEPLIDSEAVVIKRVDTDVTEDEQVILKRIQGILNAYNYLMIDYNIHKDNLDAATNITPGLTGPTVSPLAREDWVAARAMVPKKQANQLMDDLSKLGAEAILASELRIARI